MTEVSRVAARSPVGLDEFLLAAKLAIPPAREGFVSRADLVGRARSCGRRVVAVSAPAGYGKSSLLAQWAEVETRPVVWVSLDRLDDDPGTLLSLVASGFSRATGADVGPSARMRGNASSMLARSAPRLASALRSSETPFVLMLDDLHQIRSAAAEDVLSVIISGVPEGSQFVAASRSEQPHVPRLRAEDQTLELGADDLAFDADAARQIFAAADIELSPELADAVVERTEGWAVGIHLAAVIARDARDPEATITGDDRYVADYLYRESLAHATPEVQAFLRRTSILDRFTASLCDAVTGEVTSCGRLRELERSNVFLIPLDRRREWFRYHPLFREFLLGELDRVEPEIAADLHTRAADWYEVHGAAALAVEHLMATPDRERCIRTVAELAMPTYRAGQIELVQRWIEELGPSVADEHPPLAVVAGWITLIAGRPDEAVRWAGLAEAAEFDGVPFDGSASFDSGRAMLQAIMCARGAERATADAERALAAEPPWSTWRDQALNVAAESRLLVGDITGADVLFAQASQAALVVGNAGGHVLAEAERAIIEMDRGHWSQALVQLESSLASIERRHLHDYAMAAVAFAAAARHALHRGDRRALERELTRAMRARPVCTYAIPSFAVRVRLMLAKTYWAMGDRAATHHLLHEIDDVLIQRPHLGVLVDEVAEFTTLTAQGTGAAGGSPLTPAELRLLPYLQTHLTLPEIGARLFISRNTVATEVGSIYRKLGVSSRAEAVERTIAMGLLGD